MIIERLDVHHIRLPLPSTWRFAAGAATAIDSVLVHAFSTDGDAWAETCPLATPTYLPETAASVTATIAHVFGPKIVGRTITDAREFDDILAPYRGNSFAKAGLELAWWALAATTQNVPLRHLLGGGDRPVRIGAAIGIRDTIDDILAEIAALPEGCPRLKLKIGRGWDLEVVRAVRSAFPALPLSIDCNGAYTLDDIPMFRALDTLELEMIEQPLYYRDLSDHAELQAALITPVCLDESICSITDAVRAIRRHACRIVNIKVGRVGGINAALDIHDRMRDAGIRCWIGSMFESSIGAAINVELATLPNFTLPAAIPPSHTLRQQDLTEPAIEHQQPWSITPTNEAYIGRTVVESRVEAATITKLVVAP